MAEAEILHQILTLLRSPVNISENWDSYPVGSPPPAPWVTVVGQGYAHVVSDVHYLSTKALRVYSSFTPTRATLPFVLTNPLVTVIEAAIMAETSVTGAIGRRFSIGDSGFTEECFFYFHNDGHLWFQINGADYDLGAYVFGTWYKLFIVMDNGNVYFYLNGTRWPNVGVYVGAGTNIERVWIQCNANSNSICLDALKVYDSIAPSWSENFDAYAPANPPPPPWVVTLVGAGTCLVTNAVSQSPANSLCLTSPAAGSAKADRIIPIPPGHNVRVNASLRCGTNTNQVLGRYLQLIAADGTPLIEIKFHNMARILVMTGAGPLDLGGFVINTWYGFKLHIDNSAKTFYIEYAGILYGPLAFISAAHGAVQTLDLTTANDNNDFYADDIACYSYPILVDEGFETYPVNADPPAPWVVIEAGTASGLVQSTVKHGTAGNALALISSGPLSRVDTSRVQTFPVITKGTIWLYVHHTPGAAVASSLSFIASATGDAVFHAYVLDNDHLYILNGFAIVDLGVVPLDTWFELVVHLDVLARTWTLEFLGVTWPPAGSYAGSYNQTIDTIQFESYCGSCDLYVDDIVIADEEFVPGVIYTNDFPNITPQVPMIVVQLASFGHGYSWVGANASGKFGFLRPCTVDLAIIVPWFKSSEDIKLDSSEGQLLDKIAKFVRNLIIRNQTSLVGFVDVSVIAISKTIYVEVIDSLARMYQLKFRYSEEV